MPCAGSCRVIALFTVLPGSCRAPTALRAVLPVACDGLLPRLASNDSMRTPACHVRRHLRLEGHVGLCVCHCFVWQQPALPICGGRCMQK